MVESSKILTVSYGTFSCTLEGFEDSFSTMKAIAEYFRDLAERDRYFGAEPPTPDAEMLTRIAEREIDRRVEARTEDNGIVLRAAAALSGDETSVPAMPPAAQAPANDAVAEIEIPEAVDTEVASEEEIVTDAADTPDADIPEAVEPVAESADFQAESEEEMDVAGGTTFEDMAPETLERAEAHPDADTVAAKLQRIRAVVGGAAGSDIMSDTLDEANTPEPFAFDAGNADHEVAQDEPEVQEDEEVEAFEEETLPTEESLEALDDIEIVAEDTDGDLVSAELTEDTIEEEGEADAFFGAQTSRGEDEEDTQDTADQDGPFADIDSDLIASIAANAETDAEDASVEDEPVAEAKPTIRARILRTAKPKIEDVEAAEAEVTQEDIKLEDVVAAIDGSAEQTEAAPEAFDSITTLDGADELSEFDDIPVGSLSDEDEAELQSDLAAALAEEDDIDEMPAALDFVEADELQEPTTEEVDGAQEEDDVAEDLAPLQLTDEDLADDENAPNRLPENDDEAMSRIMDQADEQLSEPEGSRRRNAIAQLKAAVAATEAARQLGDAAETPEEAQQEFRKDFDEVVRPRRAEKLPRAEVRTERPRPAPLKLVASQRIDEEAAESAAHIAPRRIASDQDAAAGSENFAEYAAEVGATELQDLLEAAAAYSAYVEGNEDFSRPQIMKWVQQSAREEFSREDSLRSFGTLLRDGRISKVRNGRFQVTDQTRFRPEQKAG